MIIYEQGKYFDPQKFLVAIPPQMLSWFRGWQNQLPLNSQTSKLTNHLGNTCGWESVYCTWAPEVFHGATPDKARRNNTCADLLCSEHTNVTRVD